MNNETEAAGIDPRPGAYRARWVAAICEVTPLSVTSFPSEVIAMAFDATWIRLELCGRAAELASKAASAAGTAAYNAYLESFRANGPRPASPPVFVPFSELIDAAAEHLLNPAPVPDPSPEEVEAWRQVIYADQLSISRHIGVLNRYLYLRGPWDRPEMQPENFLSGGFTYG